MNFMKAILLSFFLVISSFLFAQSDSTFIPNYFPVRSVLSEKYDYSVNLDFPRLNNMDYCFGSYYSDFLSGRNYSYDGNMYVTGISPCEALIVVAVTYAILSIDKKFFNKPYFKKKNLLLREQY